MIEGAQCFRRAAAPARLVAAAVVVLMLSACSFFGEKPDVTRGWSAKRLYTAANEKLEEGDYETAIDYYEKLESRFPFGPLAEQAQIELAYAHFKDDSPASAIAAADRFIKLHPQHQNVDYAYYVKGLTNFSRGRGFLDRFMPLDPSERDPGAALQAFRDFEALVTRFPESKYASDARQRMQYLKNNLAMHEVHVARYYLRREAYLAAANRAKHVLENFQESTAVPEALVVMVEAYDRMGLEDLAEDALRVLKLNYPEDARTGELEAALRP